ncbi:DUF2515 family protein [Bacillus pinisoli]|uniref:DUF2515 family protein n=1 Tax=Bacillus pinisoli TaxID=2901866 RepID=UPI001FF6442F|nr:DUF2515 family protein [Bacillus pinisoli]
MVRTIHISNEEKQIAGHIKAFVNLQNKDNITRTNTYAQYFKRNPEVKWAFLASMVSRNAGWNMCDLKGDWFPKILSKELRKRLFLTYERANWLIFSDAYPQLYIYELSKSLKQDLTHLLPVFNISSFMSRAWTEFLECGDEENLLISLIINEQNLIQRPVLESPLYQKEVFNTWLFMLQDWLHFSVVLFPTRKGELYGSSVHDFKKVDDRIELGKRLAKILFHPELVNDFIDFSDKVPHTGSRHDYEQFVFKEKKTDTPTLRSSFPVIQHHRKDRAGWGATDQQIEKWKKDYKRTLTKIHINDWYKKKQEQLHAGINLDSMITNFFTK